MTDPFGVVLVVVAAIGILVGWSYVMRSRENDVVEIEQHFASMGEAVIRTWRQGDAFSFPSFGHSNLARIYNVRVRGSAGERVARVIIDPWLGPRRLTVR